MLPNNTKTVLLILLLAAIVGLLGFLIFYSQQKTITPPQPTAIPTFSPPPSISPSPSIGPLPGHTYSYLSETDIKKRQQEEIVTQLIKKLPYKGNDFTLQYNIDTNKFIAVLNSNNLQTANNELDKFLSDNKIDSRDWLYNLVIKNSAM